MELLNEKYKNYIMYGMNYFHARLTEATVSLNVENKADLVKKLYEIYEEESESNKVHKANGELKYVIEDELLEEFLILAVYVDKKLTDEDVLYTKKCGRMPEKILKAGFPYEDVKAEILKTGYTPAKAQEEELVK